MPRREKESPSALSWQLSKWPVDMKPPCMVPTDTGIASEKVAIRFDHKEESLQLEEQENRTRPSLGKPMSREWATSPRAVGKCSRSPPIPTQHELDTQMESTMPLESERHLDMLSIRKGSFLFMSDDYVEKVKDWCQFDEDQRNATF
ncbi:hypothetical protein F4677DRAFT_441803 [Hypoxylon crocopeplum]|nr:hypothetical protein F4677DRAFT_441803 [Hypoxylon crocopeplum]